MSHHLSWTVIICDVQQSILRWNGPETWPGDDRLAITAFIERIPINAAFHALQTGSGVHSRFGSDFLHSLMMGWSVSFGQNFGERMAFRQRVSQ